MDGSVARDNKLDWRIYRDRRSWSMSRLTISRCATVATAPPGTRDFDARTTSTTARTTSARITQPASTSYKPTDASAPQDSWASTARRRYPFAQRGTTPARTGAGASTTGPTIAANAQSASRGLIAPPTWMTALIICARYSAPPSPLLRPSTFHFNSNSFVSLR